MKKQFQNRIKVAKTTSNHLNLKCNANLSGDILQAIYKYREVARHTKKVPTLPKKQVVAFSLINSTSKDLR